MRHQIQRFGTAPLVKGEWIAQFILKWCRENNGSVNQIEERAGVSSRTIVKILNHPESPVSFLTADQLITKLGGVPVFPDDCFVRKPNGEIAIGKGFLYETVKTLREKVGDYQAPQEGKLLCTKCLQWKPDEEFGRCSRTLESVTRRGRLHRCKSCFRSKAQVPCPDCGKKIHRSSSCCVDCFRKRKAEATVRPTTLKCCKCHKWKPDKEFHLRKEGSPTRRNRRGECKDCAKKRRQSYRRRDSAKSQ